MTVYEIAPNNLFIYYCIKPFIEKAALHDGALKIFSTLFERIRLLPPEEAR